MQHSSIFCVQRSVFFNTNAILQIPHLGRRKQATKSPFNSSIYIGFLNFESELKLISFFTSKSTTIENIDDAVAGFSTKFSLVISYITK